MSEFQTFLWLVLAAMSEALVITILCVGIGAFVRFMRSMWSLVR